MEKISSTLLIAAHKRDHKKFLSKLTDPSSQDIKELQEYALRKNILESYLNNQALEAAIEANHPVAVQFCLQFGKFRRRILKMSKTNNFDLAMKIGHCLVTNMKDSTFDATIIKDCLEEYVHPLSSSEKRSSSLLRKAIAINHRDAVDVISRHLEELIIAHRPYKYSLFGPPAKLPKITMIRMLRGSIMRYTGFGTFLRRSQMEEDTALSNSRFVEEENAIYDDITNCTKLAVNRYMVACRTKPRSSKIVRLTKRIAQRLCISLLKVCTPVTSDNFERVYHFFSWILFRHGIIHDGQYHLNTTVSERLHTIGDLLVISGWDIADLKLLLRLNNRGQDILTCALMDYHHLRLQPLVEWILETDVNTIENRDMSGNTPLATICQKTKRGNEIVVMKKVSFYLDTTLKKKIILPFSDVYHVLNRALQSFQFHVVYVILDFYDCKKEALITVYNDIVAYVNQFSMIVRPSSYVSRDSNSTLDDSSNSLPTSELPLPNSRDVLMRWNTEISELDYNYEILILSLFFDSQILSEPVGDGYLNDEWILCPSIGRMALRDWLLNGFQQVDGDQGNIQTINVTNEIQNGLIVLLQSVHLFIHVLLPKTLLTTDGGCLRLDNRVIQQWLEICQLLISYCLNLLPLQDGVYYQYEFQSLSGTLRHEAQFKFLEIVFTDIMYALNNFTAVYQWMIKPALRADERQHQHHCRELIQHQLNGWNALADTVSQFMGAMPARLAHLFGQGNVPSELLLMHRLVKEAAFEVVACFV